MFIVAQREIPAFRPDVNRVYSVEDIKRSIVGRIPTPLCSVIPPTIVIVILFLRIPTFLLR